jgi:phosphoserine phosphatase
MLLRLADRLSRTDWSKALAIGLVRGLRRDALYALGRSFYRDVLDRQKISETHRLLESSWSEGKRIILASSSIDPVVSAIAEELRVEFVSSELDYRDGIATGRMKLELAGRKPDALAARGIRPRTYDVVTDNVGDRQLVAQASRAYVVVSGQRDEKRWANLRPTFIRPPLR